ncbi:hypothetical protein V3H30_07500 [Vibrio parahaemolyticus]|uniref:hypothetical protein n=1 Tax=Vibrio parahaemolyticus TaxID=670 RepID=UPI000425A5A5|nr:hypothetical protein [Vibrio parahaemolyticus]EIC9814666.1 hypothetical protein [Vibrio alginolyticus]EIA3184640.1 hypothetical protein [Vibrio parahaemolyticus]EII5415615.1 hypothetical protein [Vibrio alginolyticus]EJG1726993.1 hypothetical protein [Vibrio parahaemolyticus]ELS9502863.1 hypothetical protein [Vibrio parahaemolyticus]
MKPIDKTKAQKLVTKLEAGDFDENDVDNLFMRLRAYSHGNKVFREVADFVAHNDERNRGITNESLEAFYLSFKFFEEYTSSKKPLDITSPFPLYIKKLMKYQIDKSEESKLKQDFNVSKERLKSRLDSIFAEDKKALTASMKKGKMSEQTFRAIQHILSFIGSQPAFDQTEVVSELLRVIKANKLVVNDTEFLKYSDRIVICVMLLLHEAKFDYGANKQGYCLISSEKTSISHNQVFVDVNGNPVEHEESFGKLQVLGHVVLDKDGKDLTICYPLMTTSLEVEAWCDEEMFVIEPLSDTHPHYLYKKALFDSPLYFTEDGKLGVIQG